MVALKIYSAVLPYPEEAEETLLHSVFREKTEEKKKSSFLEMIYRETTGELHGMIGILHLILLVILLRRVRRNLAASTQSEETKKTTKMRPCHRETEQGRTSRVIQEGRFLLISSLLLLLSLILRKK